MPDSKKALPVPIIDESIKIDFEENESTAPPDSVEKFHLWMQPAKNFMVVLSVVHITLGTLCLIAVVLEIIAGHSLSQTPGLWSGATYLVTALLVSTAIAYRKLLLTIALMAWNAISIAVSVASLIICFAFVLDMKNSRYLENRLLCLARSLTGTIAIIEILLNLISVCFSTRELLTWCEYREYLIRREKQQTGHAEDGTKLKRFVGVCDKGKRVELRRPTMFLDPADPTTVEFDIVVQAPSTIGIGQRKSSIKPYTKDATKLPIPQLKKKKVPTATLR